MSLVKKRSIFALLALAVSVFATGFTAFINSGIALAYTIGFSNIKTDIAISSSTFISENK
jgi:hypothetical protein